MQIACEIRKIGNGLANNRQALKLEDFKIQYKGVDNRTPEEKQADLERATALSKARWNSRLRGFTRVNQ